MKLQFALLISLFISAAISCKKSDSVNAGKLKQVTLGNGMPFERFSYDENGLLKQMITGSIETHTIDFTHSNGLVTEAVATIVGEVPGKNKQTFRYDNSKRLIGIDFQIISPNVVIDPNSFYPSRYEFLYSDQTDRYSAQILYYRDAMTEKPMIKYEFKYDGNGNISQVDHFSYLTTGWSVPVSYGYEYGKIRNPYYRNVHPQDYEKYISKDFWIKRTRLNPPAGMSEVLQQSYMVFMGKVAYSKFDQSAGQEYRYSYN